MSDPGLAPSGKTVSLLALVACAIFVPSAQAGYPEPLARALAIADAHWPDSPCHGKVTLIGVDGAWLDMRTGTVGAIAGAPQDGACHVLVSWPRLRRYIFRRKCRIFVHEFGHLAGYTHNNNLNSVMYGENWDIPNNALDCWHAFPNAVPSERPS